MKNAAKVGFYTICNVNIMSKERKNIFVFLRNVCIFATLLKFSYLYIELFLINKISHVKLHYTFLLYINTYYAISKRISRLFYTRTSC